MLRSSRTKRISTAALRWFYRHCFPQFRKGIRLAPASLNPSRFLCFFVFSCFNTNTRTPDIVPAGILRSSRTKRSFTAAFRRFCLPRRGSGTTRASCSTRRATETSLRLPSRRNTAAALTEKLANRCVCLLHVYCSCAEHRIQNLKYVCGKIELSVYHIELVLPSIG